MLDKKYTLLLEDKTMHDGCAILLDNEKILCILENERITKHKHAVYEECNEIVDYIINAYNIDRNDISIIHDNINIPYNNHHELHAAATYFSSGFDKASILVIDGYGDQNDCITLFAGRGNKIYELKKYDVKYSLGLMYDCAARILYNGAAHSEGKMMGLSCCSDPEYSIPSPIQFHEDGTVENLTMSEEDTKCSEENMIKYIQDHFAYLFDDEDNILKSDVYKAKIAATVQWWFTEQVKNIVKYLKSINPSAENLCVCGGCFLNCETNGIIDKMGLFKNIYCISAPADNSVILGRAQQYLIEMTGKPQPIKTSYWGPSHNKTYEELLDIFRIKQTETGLVSDIYNAININEYSEDWVIKKLEEDRVILWFDGESEYGPRALGHRSFLANPQSNNTFWRLSVEIKNRENYRPLAPITTDELYSLMFEDDNPENLTAFMLKTVRIKPEWQSKIKAVTHINQTARPQRLTEDINPVLYSLIGKWYKQTGIPCLINTSLNLKGQPLLETYNDLKSLCSHPNVIHKNCSVVVDHKLCFDLR